ncbi:MAG: TonB-dependent receptor [Sphingorhabdus sp.]
MSPRISLKLAACTALVGALSVLATPAVAQEAAPAQAAEDDASLGEIVVTAERRDSTIQKTPQAISAVSSETLERGGVVNAGGLQQLVPGVDVNQGGGFSQVRIRGVGGGVVNNFGEPGVAYNIAGIYLAQPYAGNAAYHDLQRVEVLKGPQGTLYGRNSTAGAINIIPNRPKLGEFAGQLSATLGNYDHLEVQGVLNVPLGDKIAARVSVSKLDHDGYFSNGQSDADITSFRGQLLFEPSDGFSVLLYADYFKENGKGPGDTPLFPGTSFSTGGAISPGATGRYLNPNDPWQNLGADFAYSSGLAAPNDVSRPYANPSISHEQLILSAELKADLGFADLTVIPALVTTKVDDQLANYAYNSFVFTDAKQTSLEARLSSKPGGPLQWVLGAYLYDQNNNSTQSFFQRGRGYITLGTPTLDTNSFAVFGQATYSLTDDLRITGGVRYTEEKKVIAGATVAPGVPAFLCPNYIVATGTGLSVTDRCSVTNVGNLKFNATNWKVGLEYDVSDTSLLYGSVSTGFRAGGFNPGAPPNTFPPEELTAYEIGSKNEFMGGKLRLNVSGFYWDYAVESSPVLGPINPVGLAFIVIPASSHVYGVEMEAAAKLSRNDTLSVNMLYQHAEYDKYSTLAIPFIGLPAFVYDGMRRSHSPTWSGNVSYEHVFNLASGATVTANVDMHFESKTILALQQPEPIGYSRDGYATGNLSLTYSSPDDNYTIGAFVNNVTDKFVPTSVFQSTSTGNVFQQSQPPRTYGVRASVKF